MRLIFLSLFLFISPVVWAATMAHQVSLQTVDNPLIGKPVPDVVLANTDGSSGSILGATKGKKSVLIFWATWCPHCHEELNALSKNLPAIEKQNFKIILVDIGETKEKVTTYFARHQLQLTSFIDEDTVSQGLYRLNGVPSFIFIDEKGLVRNVTHVFPSDYTKYFSAN